MKKLNWSDMKTFITGRSASLQYIDFDKFYYIMAFDGPIHFHCEVGKTNPVEVDSDQEDFENNYKSNANKPLQDYDETGRPITRYAATVKGWHYQAHSVQFEVNKLDSIYNKDHNGNDLGYCSIKVYDNQGTELTTQASVDTAGVKTVVKWQPDFNFEVISGNVRQITKETVDTYMYVNAVVATGLPSPYNWLTVPFVQGGINLNYIGADEPLKTDGRASKLFNAATNGDYFEIVCNYDSNLISNTNRHKMSIIFEIYKDPMS